MGTTMLLRLLLVGLLACSGAADMEAESEAPAPLMAADGEFNGEYSHMPTHAFVHNMQAQAFERHLAAQAAAAATAPALAATEEARALHESAAVAGVARSAAVSNIVGEIRIATSLDATVLALTATQQALVSTTVATAVNVLRKFYKVNQPWTTPLVISPAVDCSTGCTGACSSGTPASYAVPTQLKNGTGQPLTDLFIVVRAGLQDQCTNTVAWAFSCSFDTTTNRPIQGFVNICPYFFQDAQFSPPLATRVDTVVHEITHALGFTSEFFFKVLNENTTGLDAYGDTVNYINSTRVAATTQAHFGCPAALGAQLEDQGGSGSKDSHWDYRLFWGELMAPSGGYLLSNFTLGVMADLGWYTPRYNFAAPFVRGRGVGCTLLTQTCASIMSASTSQPYYCGTGTGSCVDAYDKAECSGANFVFNKPTSCQLATNFGASDNDDCRSTTTGNAFDYVSSGSQCLTTVYSSATIGGCFDTTCTTAGAVMLVAHPANGGANISVPCPTGTTVDMHTQASAAYSKSTVVTCPNNAVVCGSLSCNPGCNSTNGQCVSGTCMCYNEWIGIDCNLHVDKVLGSFDDYSPTSPPYPPPLVLSPPATLPPPPPPYAALDPTQPQIQLTVQTTIMMNYTALVPVTLTSASRQLESSASRQLEGVATTLSRQLVVSVTVSLTTFRTDFVSAVAAALKVPLSSINITSFTGTDNSALVVFTVLPGVTTAAAATLAIAPFTSDAYAALGVAFDTKYGVTGATAVVITTASVILTPLPPPSPPPPPASTKVSVPLAIIIGATVGGVVALAVVVGLICYCSRSSKVVDTPIVIQVAPAKFRRSSSSVASPRSPMHSVRSMEMNQFPGAGYPAPQQPPPYGYQQPPQAQVFQSPPSYSNVPGRVSYYQPQAVVPEYQEAGPSPSRYIQAGSSPVRQDLAYQGAGGPGGYQAAGMSPMHGYQPSPQMTYHNPQPQYPPY